MDDVAGGQPVGHRARVEDDEPAVGFDVDRRALQEATVGSSMRTWRPSVPEAHPVALVRVDRQ